MEDKKKTRQAVFTKDANIFESGADPKGAVYAGRAGGKRSGGHQPRDADTASGHNVQKPGRRKYKFQKDGGFAQNDNKQMAGTEDIRQFTEARNGFSGNGGEDKAEPEFYGSKKSDRLRKDVAMTRKRVQAARKKIPKKKEYSLERVFDEEKGKAKYVLVPIEKETPFKSDNPLKFVTSRASAGTSNFIHGKIAQVEKENSAVEGAHKTEQKAGEAYYFVKRHHKPKQQRNRERVAGLEKIQFQKEAEFRYQKFLEENSVMQENSLKKQMQRRIQKQRIKKEYAKAHRAGQTARNTKETAAKTTNTAAAAAKKVQEIAEKHISALAVIAAFGLFFFMIMGSLASCGAIFTDSVGSVFEGSYLSKPEELDKTEVAMTELEALLELRIKNIETEYPDYDGYRYNLDAIGHDPFTLINYLSAVYTEFTASEVQAEVESLFDEMYSLTLTPVEETRVETVEKTKTIKTYDPVIGAVIEKEVTYEVQEEYTDSFLTVELKAKDLETIVSQRMNGEQAEFYALYGETHGMLQQFYSPVNRNWYDLVCGNYGYRANVYTQEIQFHRGIDILLTERTPVLAAMNGIVAACGYEDGYGTYALLVNETGHCIRYGHLDVLRVHTGQVVRHGDEIGRIGGLEQRLRIECFYDGEYYNPLFYFECEN